MKKILLTFLFLFNVYGQANLVVSDEIVLFGLNLEDGQAPKIFDCKNNYSCIYLEGNIQAGDFEQIKPQLEAKLFNFYAESHRVFSKNAEYTFTEHQNFDASKTENFQSFRVFISSGGGDLSEAIKIAKLIREFELTVSIPMSKKCISACFFIYSGAVTRLVSDKAEVVGIHTPYFDKNVFKELSQKEADALYRTKIAETYKQLELFNVPKKFIAIMKNTPSDEIYYLNLNEVADLAMDPIFRERLLASLKKITFDEGAKSGISNLTIKEFQLRAINEYEPGLIEKETIGQVLESNLNAQRMIISAITSTDLDPRDYSEMEYMNELAINHPKQFAFVAELAAPWHQKLVILSQIQALLADLDSVKKYNLETEQFLALMFTDIY